ncbi:ROK family transcriptional regulator [Streptomyces sp. NRRL F-4489]|uniref:ROK family transcriptional regulator n=1 Tax=Streptomyces sp. NRRL F-4489 TaxID=1609095 RepID=UPI000749EEF5|nr:ROK family transcriptional regulator [Streptomyces sp. NRRL F-4489]KUL47201.1 ROK family transcriptional regulator [Streptomyces sp. NRRL F-4489]
MGTGQASGGGLPGAPGGANLLALRGHNTALVLGLLRSAGEAGASRLELAERTGLTPQAVSKITARLRAAGLVAEAGRRASTGGKPRTVLRLVPGARHAIGVHLDRDEITCVLADLTGRPVAVRRAPLDFAAGAGPVLAAVDAEVAALRADAGGPPVLGAGVACPGPLDHTAGVLRQVTGAPRWDGFPLRDALADRLGLPVVLDKDTNAAALGLTRAPEGAGGSFAYVHLGTGLGAGLVLGGGLYRGPRTGAGEFGHQVVRLDGEPCGCGRRGCVEALCLAAVARGDLPAAARVLGVAAANLVELLDVERVLLGGRTVLAHPEEFRGGVARVLDEHAALRGGDSARGPGGFGGPGESGATPAVPVALAPGGTRAVADGAAELVLADLFR